MNKLRNRLLLEAYFKTANPAILEKLPYSIPRWHLNMLKDKSRLDFYNQIIKENVKDKIVLDVGTGSGILSHLAIKHGAKKVYSVEMQHALQDVYSVLMEKPINDGVAKLIEKNAINLSIQDLDGNMPDVVIHEIFGSDVFSENVVGVFEVLKSNNIVSKDTKCLPGRCKLMAEGILYKKEFDDNLRVEDYEGYALSKLDDMAAINHQFWEYKNSQSIKVQKTGSPQILYESTMPDFEQLDDLIFKLDDKINPTHIRTWMILEMDDHKLETHHDINQSHWSNSVFEIPKTMSHKKEARFKVKENRLTFTGLTFKNKNTQEQ